MKLVTVLGFTISTLQPPYTTGKIKKDLSLVPMNGLMVFFFFFRSIFSLKKEESPLNYKIFSYYTLICLFKNNKKGAKLLVPFFINLDVVET